MEYTWNKVHFLKRILNFFKDVFRELKIKIDDFNLKRFEKKMKRLRPELLSFWYEEQEEKIRKEYEEEFETLQFELYEARKNLSESKKNTDYWKGKYEGVSEIQDKVREQLITKIETSSVDKGKLKEQVKQLKEEQKDEQQNSN